jgi:hypothetical protein
MSLTSIVVEFIALLGLLAVLMILTKKDACIELLLKRATFDNV